MAHAKKLPYAVPIFGRDGKVRWYYRKRGQKDVRLPGLFGSPEFMGAYTAAISKREPIEIGAKRAKAGTIASVIGLYLASAAFAGLAADTRSTRRCIMDRLRKEHGDKPIALIERKHVKAMVDAKAATPTVARNLLQMLRVLVAFAIEAGICRDDPTIGVSHAKIKIKGHATWEEAEIAVFEAHHPIGTKARLAFALALHTAQRRGDIVRMSRRDVLDDEITIKQKKTGEEVTIPIAPELRDAIDAMPVEHMVFLTTASGKPFDTASFGNWFRERCREAGVRKGLSLHGLRKAACRRLAEAGCTPHEIMAISGHTTLKEVTRYTNKVDRKHMARAAMKRLRGTS
jgi:integrase